MSFIMLENCDSWPFSSNFQLSPTIYDFQAIMNDTNDIMNDINDIINGKRSFPLHEQSGSQSSFAKNENVSGFALL